jgi:hypothetical protein
LGTYLFLSLSVQWTSPHFVLSIVLICRFVEVNCERDK